MTKPFGIVIHGGAGTIQLGNQELEKEVINTLQNIVEKVQYKLKNNISAVVAVEIAITELENNPFFNAGKGAVYTNAGDHELDAAIMDGKTLETGAVAGVHYSPNPIMLARTVMEKSNHVFLIGEGADTFAKEHNLPQVTQDYFDTEERYKQYLYAKEHNLVALESAEDAKDNKFGTVGAVALDLEGNLAAGTSTGGITNKSYGRVGDSPIIGAGTYANNKTCAISATGYGELFIKKVVAYDIHARMLYQNKSLKEASDEVIIKELDANIGGIIAIDSSGNIALPFNTSGMYRAFATDKIKACAQIHN